MKKLTTLFLTAITAAAISLPVFADNSFSSVIYREPGNSSSWVSIPMEFEKGETLDRSSIKSSNTSVFRPTTHSRYSSVNYNLETKEEENGYSSEDLQGMSAKPGKATITYKSNKGNTYTAEVTTLKYVNPVKTLTLTGVNSGKNLAGKFKSARFLHAKAKKTASPKLTIKAKSGWVISHISVYKRPAEGDRESISYYHSFSGNYPTSKTIKLPFALEKNKEYSIYISFMNKKNGGENSVDLYLNHSDY